MTRFSKTTALIGVSLLALAAPPAWADATPECNNGTAGNSTECGTDANTNGVTDATAVGDGAEVTAGAIRAIAVGNAARANGIRSIAIGASSTANGNESIAVGESSGTFGDFSVAIGGQAEQSPARSVFQQP